MSAEATDPQHPLHAEFADRYLSSGSSSAEVLRAAQEAGEVRADLDPVRRHG